MSEVTVPIRLDLLLDEAIKEAKKASDAIAKQLDGVGSSAKGVEKASTALAGLAIAGVVVAGIQKLAGAMGDFVNEAADAERVSAGLVNALRVSGDYSQDAVDGFKDLADSLAEVTKYDDDLILSQVKVAKTFNTSNAETTKLIKASVQLASVLDVDLTTATNLLGKTLDGTAGKLNETIPDLRKFSKEALVSGAALDYVIQRFGGSAESEIKTFSGALAQSEKAAKNTGEALGNLIVKNETFVALINLATEGFKEFEKVVNENSDVIKAFIDAGLATAIDLFGIFVIAIKTLDEVLTACLVPLNIFARTLQFVFGGIGNLLSLDLKGLAESLNIIGNVSKDNKAQNAALAQRVKAYDKITMAAAKASNFLTDQLNTTTQINKISGQVTKDKDDQAKASERLALALKDERKAFEEQTRKFGLTQLQQIQAEQSAALKKNYELFRNTSKYLDLEYSIKSEYEKKIAEERERLLKEHMSKLQGLVSNPSQGLFGPQAEGGSETGARIVGAASNVLQGRQGAVTLMSGIAEELGKAFLGIPGLGQLFGLLAQGPEQVKAFAKEFVESVPEIITAVIESTPAIIDGLIAGLPKFIEGIIKALPKIVVALGRTFLLYLPDTLVKALEEAFNRFFSEIWKGAGRFVDEILKGAGQFIDRLIQGIGDGIAKIFDGLNPFSGSNSGVGGLVRGIGDFVGGIVSGIGGLFGKTGGAAVSDGGGFQRSGTIQQSGNNKPVQVNLQIGQRQLAQAMVDLNRQGFRTA